MSHYVGIKFCQECNNMLHPREDRVNKTLLYSCKNCEYEEPAESSCVYINRIQHTQDELTQIITDVTSDPTLPRTKDQSCPKCGHEELVFFQSQMRRSDEGMQLYYVCCNNDCKYRWVERAEDSNES
eukprot:Opistho-1_new@99032